MLIYDGYYADLVTCPAFVTDNLERYIFAFNDWLASEESLHEYDEEVGTVFSFGGEDVVRWFNEFVLCDSEEKMVYRKRDYHPSRIELKTVPRFNL